MEKLFFYDLETTGLKFWKNGIHQISGSIVINVEIKESFDFIISRAVKAFPEFYGWVRNRIGKQSKNHLRNGIICLKGGDLSDELKGFAKVHIVELSHYFEEPFFETKKIVYFQG